LPEKLNNFLLSGHRLRVYGELCWVRERGILDVLAITSASRTKYYQSRGFDPVFAPLGYHPVYGTDLGLTRDIPVAFLGNIDSSRRKQILFPIINELEKRGVSVETITHLYGSERTQFLNRVIIMINILRAPQDYVGQRFILGTANKSLVVSEPYCDGEAFQPGKHLVVSPINRMVDTILEYLSNPELRKPIVDRAYAFVQQEFLIQNSVSRLLEKAARVKTENE
jgi:glycosyltransferase involved in cell wall biosynthesis